MADIKKVVFVLDVDGTLTDGKMYYTKEGKAMKAFGCDDFDALKTISSKVQIHFISGDEKGFEISKKRADEMGIPINLVPSNAQQRWDWIKQTFGSDRKIVFMGDGINDYIALRNADISFSVVDALPHVQESAKYKLQKRGGDRAVACACLILDEDLELNCFDRQMWEVLRRI